MSKIKWLFLGYILALSFNGCDLGLSSSDGDFNEITSSGLGSSPWNPVYVKIVEYFLLYWSVASINRYEY